MTTSQLEHLRLILAHLDKLLETASKRTPGEWHEGYSIVGDGIYITVCNAPQPLETLGKNWTVNRAFIASCAGNAEAGWRSTKAAIECYLFICKNNQGKALIDHNKLEAMAESILAAWPIERITKHQ